MLGKLFGYGGEGSIDFAAILGFDFKVLFIDLVYVEEGGGGLLVSRETGGEQELWTRMNRGLTESMKTHRLRLEALKRVKFQDGTFGDYRGFRERRSRDELRKPEQGGVCH